ncbi:hypothetical protein [Anoxynatronum sibiricum]|uniref:Uncharacterized protein n=1 Tax=Anoxynatronum sibiricum TaxID=210623 RepID=A0ABU9VVB9_9CLOT
MESSVLKGGIQEIAVIKENVAELDNCIEQNALLRDREIQMEKSISKKENAIEDEIKKVTRQRKTQLEAAFDEQIDTVSVKLKNVESNKEKAKKKAIMQRIDMETADFRSEDEELHLAGKSVFKQEKIPFLYNNRLFFALYFPSGIGDAGIILLTLVIAFFAIPFGLYYAFFEGMGMLYLALSYMGVILVFGGIYLTVGKTKYKHLEALHRVRAMRRSIQESKKRQRKIKRQIMKDKDESHYELGDFDQEIENYKQAVNELMEQKIKALREFDNATAEEIKQQIIATNEETLQSLKTEYQEVYDQGKENLEKLNRLSVKISTEYEGVIGKEFLTLPKLELMEEAINAGNASNIAEAMTYITSTSQTE